MYKRQNPKLKQLQAEYNAIKKQFETNKGMLSSSSGTGEIKNITESSLKYAALFREYKFRESLVSILLRQYETAKIREAQDPIVIQLLSPPTFPEIRSKPQRKKIIIWGAVLGGFLSVIFAFTKHSVERSIRNQETAPKIAYVKKAIDTDLAKIRWGKK